MRNYTLKRSHSPVIHVANNSSPSRTINNTLLSISKSGGNSHVKVVVINHITICAVWRSMRKKHIRNTQSKVKQRNMIKNRKGNWMFSLNWIKWVSRMKNWGISSLAAIHKYFIKTILISYSMGDCITIMKVFQYSIL